MKREMANKKAPILTTQGKYGRTALQFHGATVMALSGVGLLQVVADDSTRVLNMSLLQRYRQRTQYTYCLSIQATH